MPAKNRAYSTVHSAKRALRKAGLAALPVEFDKEPVNDLGREQIIPIVQCEETKDVVKVHQIGFKAVLLGGKTTRHG